VNSPAPPRNRSSRPRSWAIVAARRDLGRLPFPGRPCAGRHCLGGHAPGAIARAAMRRAPLPGQPCAGRHCPGGHAPGAIARAAMRRAPLPGRPCAGRHCPGGHAPGARLPRHDHRATSGNDHHEESRSPRPPAKPPETDDLYLTWNPPPPRPTKRRESKGRKLTTSTALVAQSGRRRWKRRRRSEYCARRIALNLAASRSGDGQRPQNSLRVPAPSLPTTSGAHAVVACDSGVARPTADVHRTGDVRPHCRCPRRQEHTRWWCAMRVLLWRRSTSTDS
jgi:hypothetical protein